MSKHTPGPWVTSLDQTNVWAKKCGTHVARVEPAGLTDGMERHDERIANACLIAASADLLAAAKALLQTPIWQGGAVEVAAKVLQRAVAKAEGRG